MCPVSPYPEAPVEDSAPLAVPLSSQGIDLVPIDRYASMR